MKMMNDKQKHCFAAVVQFLDGTEAWVRLTIADGPGRF